jgi:uncharacterized integral membrane protein
MATARKTAFTSVRTEEQAVVETEDRSNETISWTDTYYDKEPDIIAVFDVDYEGLGHAISKAKFWTVFIILIYAVVYTITFSLRAFDNDGAWPIVTSMVVFFVCGIMFAMRYTVKKFNLMKENMNGLHVAVTVGGLRRDSRNFPLGMIFKTKTVVSIWNYSIDVGRFLYFSHIPYSVSSLLLCVFVGSIRRDQENLRPQGFLVLLRQKERLFYCYGAVGCR